MRTKAYVIFSFFSLLTLSCIEEIPIQDEVENFDDLLVVEGTITNQMKIQEVRLSRTYDLEATGPSPESGATVNVVASTGESFAFVMDEPGLYRSQSQFAAETNVAYQLEITTANGRQYQSEPTSFTGPTQIDNLYLERNFDENQVEGVSIYVDTQDPSGTSEFYRFEYEETYKIIAPKYSPLELVIQNDDFPYPLSAIDGLEGEELIEFFVDRDFRPEQEQLCYNTVKSNEIMVVDATQFDNNTIERFRVRFLNRDNYIISHRYSLLVKQYVQSLDAYTFYNTLSNLSDSETIFSEVQTGFIPGNMHSLSNANETVVGFFEVVAADEERIYFNYEDLFPGEDLPPYYIPCDAVFIPDLYFVAMFTEFISYSPIQDRINDGYQYWDETESGPFQPYQLVLPACGDCTQLGETQIPDFWEE